MKKILITLAILLTGCARVTPIYGTITEKTLEGGTQYNDYYIVVLDDGNMHEIEADDLEVGDRVTVYFYEDEPVRTLYGER